MGSANSQLNLSAVSETVATDVKNVIYFYQEYMSNLSMPESKENANKFDIATTGIINEGKERINELSLIQRLEPSITFDEFDEIFEEIFNDQGITPFIIQ